MKRSKVHGRTFQSILKSTLEESIIKITQDSRIAERGKHRIMIEGTMGSTRIQLLALTLVCCYFTSCSALKKRQNASMYRTGVEICSQCDKAYSGEREVVLPSGVKCSYSEEGILEMTTDQRKNGTVYRWYFREVDGETKPDRYKRSKAGSEEELIWSNGVINQGW